jgi:antitoxin (DNA-binding transcriptional repressor) of toxin-antitoxin stability system
MVEMTVTATELARRTGELLRLVEHGATITVIDAKHGWTRAVISPPPQPPGFQGEAGTVSA